MSKILITNNMEWYNDLSECFSDFKKSFSYEKNNLFIAAYKKLNLDVSNCYEERDDFIILSGTGIYKEQMGLEALKQLLRDSYTSSVKMIRKNMLGSYGIVVKNANDIRIFLDETHTYYLYYYNDGENYIITNTYWHIAKVANAKVNENALLELGVRRCIMSNKTPFQGVLKLCAKNVININIESGVFEVLESELNDYHQNYKCFNDAVKSIANEIYYVSSCRSKYIKRIQHFLTGGIDSRLEAAIHIKNNDNVLFSYWIGKDLLTNGTESDLNIVKDISESYGCKYKIYNVEEDFIDSIRSLTFEKCKKYGEFSGNYGGNTKVLDIFEHSKQVDWMNFGYLGETLRPLAELERCYKKGFTIGHFVRDVYCRTGLEKELFVLNGFYEYVENEMKSLVTLSDDNFIDINDAFKLFSYSRFDADCYMNNLVNMFVYSFPIFGQKRIADKINSIPYEWLSDEKLTVSLIEKIEKKLLDFPIYSHHRKFVYNKKTSTIHKTYKYMMLDTLKPVLKNTPIYTVLYIKWLHRYIRPQSSLSESIAAECYKMIKKFDFLNTCNYDIRFNGSWNGVDIGTLVGFAVDLKGIDLLKNRS